MTTPRSMMSRIIRLALATTFLLTLVLTLLSFLFEGEWWTLYGKCLVTLRVGAIEVDYDWGYFNEECKPASSFLRLSEIAIWSKESKWKSRLSEWFDYGCVPRVESLIPDERMYIPLYIIPLWIPLILSGGPLCILRIIDRRRRHRSKQGRCTACGYDLQGNISGTCPECGTEPERSISAE